jgi:hypothetical protein
MARNLQLKKVTVFIVIRYFEYISFQSFEIGTYSVILAVWLAPYTAP